MTEIMRNTALITGASKGIGLELAKIHAQKGDNLVIVARTLHCLHEIKNEFETRYGINVLVIEKDLTFGNAASEVFDELNGKGVTLDYLINNAGFGDYGLFAETDWEKQEKMISLNVTALAHLTRLFLPGMIARGKGRILNVASLAAFPPGPKMSVYFASKAFVLSFSQAIHNENKDRGVTCTVLCPGSTDTEFHEVATGDRSRLKERKMDSATDVAEYGYNAMMKGKPVAIYGAKNRFLIFLSRFAPREMIVKTTRKIQEKKHE
jgi:uncharacterized protein